MSEAKSVSRLNALLVLEVLKKHSSYEHPITNTQVLKYAQNELKKMGMYEEKEKNFNPNQSVVRQLSTSTVGRILDSMAELCFYYPSFVKLLNGTVFIRLTSNIPGREYITYNPDKDEYPLPAYMWPTIKDMIFDKDFGTMIRQQSDVSNNTQDNTQNSFNPNLYRTNRRR